MRTFSWWMAALLMLQTGVANAQDNNGDNAPDGDDSATRSDDNARTDGPRFGDTGILAISSDVALSIERQSTSGVPGGTTTIQLAPAADYFVGGRFSLGGFIGFDYVKAGDNDATRFAIGPRLGYDYRLSDMVSLWPRAGVSLAVTSADNAGPGDSAEDTTFALNLFVPLMVHPARHFFIGLGPFLDTDLSGDARTTTFGLKLTTGGWLDMKTATADED